MTSHSMEVSTDESILDLEPHYLVPSQSRFSESSSSFEPTHQSFDHASSPNHQEYQPHMTSPSSHAFSPSARTCSSLNSNHRPSQRQIDFNPLQHQNQSSSAYDYPQYVRPPETSHKLLYQHQSPSSINQLDRYSTPSQPVNFHIADPIDMDESERAEDGTKGEEGEYQWKNHIAGAYKEGVGYDTVRSNSRRGSKAIADEINRMEKDFKKAANRNQESRTNSMNPDGSLAAVGRKKRLTLRLFQGFGACGVMVGSIGAAVFTTPAAPPPPAAKLSLYMLYILPFFSLGLTIYLFLIRPRLSTSSSSATDQRRNSMVIPLLNGETGSHRSGCCGSGGKKKNHPGQINLIVDPFLFGRMSGGATDSRSTDVRRDDKERRKRGRKRKARETTESDSDASTSSTSSTNSSDAWSVNAPTSSGPRRGGYNTRKGVLSAVHLEEKWRLARKSLKIVAIFDVVLVLLWTGASIWAIIFGSSCKPGTFEGWCDYYNTAEAIAVLLSISFILSVIFGILDLKRTAAPPRRLNSFA